MDIFGVVAIVAFLSLAGYNGARWAFKKDTAIEKRRLAASRLAGTLRTLGLAKTPEFLESYSVGDYSGMGEKIADLVKLFASGEGAVVREFAQVFEGCLTAKLKSAEGRAYIAAKLADVEAAGKPAA